MMNISSSTDTKHMEMVSHKTVNTGSSTGDIEIGNSKEFDYNPMRRSNLGVLLVVLGLYVCFLASTIFQERLYAFRSLVSQKNGVGDRFESAPLLTLTKSLTNVIVSRTAIHFRRRGERIKPPRTSSLVMAVIRFSSTLLSLYSLNFVSYPCLILGRSVKILPVLVSEFIFDRKIPSLRRCMSVIVTTAGMLVFSLPSLFKKQDDPGTTGKIGFLLIFMSLCADGGLSLSQKRMVKVRDEKPHVFETMYVMSSWQAFFSFLVLIVFREGRGGVEFCMENPEVISLMVWPALIEAVGQSFIYELVIYHGPFFTTVITTLRKFITVILSVVLFGHSISMTQWVAISMVFVGCFIDLKGSR